MSELEEFLALKKALASKQREQDKREAELEVIKKQLKGEFSCSLEEGPALVSRLEKELAGLEEEFSVAQQEFKNTHGEALGLCS